MNKKEFEKLKVWVEDRAVYMYVLRTGPKPNNAYSRCRFRRCMRIWDKDMRGGLARVLPRCGPWQMVRLLAWAWRARNCRTQPSDEVYDRAVFHLLQQKAREKKTMDRVYREECKKGGSKPG